MTPAAPQLILASASSSRQTLLAQAGVPFSADPAAIDEQEIKRALRAEDATADAVAETLAELKAQKISRRHPEALVLGADQMLEHEGAWLDKPADIAAARAQLLSLAGSEHRLVSAQVLVAGGRRLWHHVEAARLTMRPFDDGFVDSYLQQVGERALASVGAYQLEGLGIQLFSRIEGDYFAILGLPLLPLLQILREHGVIAR